MIDRLISSLDSRVFLLHNVHQNAPVVFQTRWAMSYLRGPLTRQQVKPADGRPQGGRGTCTGSHPRPPDGTNQPGSGSDGGSPGRGGGASNGQRTARDRGGRPVRSAPPAAPPGVNQVFLPVRTREGDAVAVLQAKAGAAVKATDCQLVCEPALVGVASVSFVDCKTGLNESERRRRDAAVGPTGHGGRLARLGACRHRGT